MKSSSPSCPKREDGPPGQEVGRVGRSRRGGRGGAGEGGEGPDGTGRSLRAGRSRRGRGGAEGRGSARSHRSGAFQHGFGLLRTWSRLVAFSAASRAAQGERAGAAWPGCGGLGSDSVPTQPPLSQPRGARPGCAGKELAGTKLKVEAGPGTCARLGSGAHYTCSRALHTSSGDLPLSQGLPETTISVTQFQRASAFACQSLGRVPYVPRSQVSWNCDYYS